jgi:hypothetical protein
MAQENRESQWNNPGTFVMLVGNVSRVTAAALVLFWMPPGVVSNLTLPTFPMETGASPKSVQVGNPKEALRKEERSNFTVTTKSGKNETIKTEERNSTASTYGSTVEREEQVGSEKLGAGSQVWIYAIKTAELVTILVITLWAVVALLRLD